ncbi:MAG: hypothetical protein HY235_28850 [Acidobacteria bacterium]|nr:hypothetical protein [Acidobacteriota bacterium]
MTPRRSSLMVGVYLLLVFLSGALVGAFGYRLYSAKAVGATARSVRSQGHDAFRQRYLKDMESRLKLDASQMQKLVAILDETRARYKATRDRMDPEMKQIQLEQRDRIRGILSADQKPEYEKMLEERERKRREQSHGPGC